MYQQQFLATPRLTTAYYRAGQGNEKKLLLLHGNVSSSVFYLPLFEALSAEYDIVAPDLRCYGDSTATVIDATKGLKDWSDDLDEFLTALGWDKFAFAGWSMGGGIAMQYAIDHSEKLTGIILIAPLSPFGFGGTKGETGEKLEPLGIGSGGGAVNVDLIAAVANHTDDFLRTTLNTLYFKPPYVAEPDWEAMFIDSMAKTKAGEGMYPGEGVPSAAWPGVASGVTGTNNTMSPAFCDVSAMADIPAKPPVLWFRGDADLIVSDTSLCDFGFLGQIGAVPGWPGLEEAPPQPMIAQTRWMLDRYAANGGTYRELMLPGGHAIHLEQAEAFVAAVRELLG